MKPVPRPEPGRPPCGTEGTLSKLLAVGFDPPVADSPRKTPLRSAESTGWRGHRAMGGGRGSSGLGTSANRHEVDCGRGEEANLNRRRKWRIRNPSGSRSSARPVVRDWTFLGRRARSARKAFPYECRMGAARAPHGHRLGAAGVTTWEPTGRGSVDARAKGECAIPDL